MHNEGLMKCRRMALCALAAFAALAGATAAAAQSYPDRPVRLIVPYAAGGANDIIARLIQPHLEKALGQPVIVDNRPAASGIVGTDAVAKAAPDGHHLVLAFTTFTVNQAVNPKLPYDIEKDLAPVIMVGKSPLMFIVNAKVPANNLAEFIALAKAARGKFNYATPGASSQAHLLVAWWSALAGVEMQHLPYRGGAPAVLGTVTGDAQLTVMSPMASLPQIEAGTLRPIAIGSLERAPSFPNLPTVAEQGFPGFEAVAWCGLFTTAGTPKEVVARLNAEINRIIRDPQVASKLEELTLAPTGGSPEAFGAFVSAEIRRWREAAKAAKIIE
jgi:tripartite-type tricarboxylate transporter receptor subunit TctC